MFLIGNNIDIHGPLFRYRGQYSLSHRGVEFGLVIGVLPLPGKEEIDDLLRARQTADMGGEDPHGPDRTRCDRSLPSQ
jgi:hypothetical protein